MSLQLPRNDAPNLAPVGNLAQNIERQAQDNSILIEPDWFKKQKGTLENEDKSVWDDETLKWALVFNMIEGRQLLKRAKYGAGWRAAPLPDRTDIPVYGYNLSGFYSEGIKAKWTQSSTDITWRQSRGTDDAIGMAKAGNVAHDHYKRRLYTQSFKQMEALLAQCGKYARYYYYTDEVKSYGRRPITGTESVQFGESSYFCADCGSSGPMPADMGAGDTGFSAGGAAPEQFAGGLGEGIPISDAAGLGAGTLPTVEGEIPGDPTKIGRREAVKDLAANGGPVTIGGAEYSAEPGTMNPLDVAGGVNTTLSRVEQPPPATCPECGSPNAEVEQAQPLEVEAIQGYEDVEHGDIVCETVPAFELKHDLGELPQDSPYLIRRRRVRVPVLQAKFPDLHITDSKGENRGIQIAEALKKVSSQNNRSSSKDSNEEQATDFIQIWLDPCMYSKLQLKDEMQTLGGMTIPAGTKLAELFPTGLYMCFIEGIDGVVELRDEHHKDYWVGQSYRQRAISSLGIGIEDIVEGNRQYNLVMSIIYTQLRTAAMPATLFDERLLPNGTSAYIGSLSNLPVNLAALEDNRRLQDAVFQLQPQPPTTAHFGFADKLNNYMQMASRVTEFSGGLPGVQNDTATGAEITQATAQSLFGPQLALKAEVDRRGAEIILELFKRYCIDEVWVTLSGKRGQMDGMWLKAADIGVDMFAEVVPDSYLPQTNMERRERWDRFLERVGGLPGLKLALQEFPEQVEQLAEIFDVDLASADYTAAAEMCRLRIEQMKQAIPMLQVMTAQMPPVQMAQDPMTGETGIVPVDPMAEAGGFLLGILQPPIELEETGHMAAIAYYRSWFTEDEGREAAGELRAGIKAAIYRHIEGVMAEAQLIGAIGMMGQPAQEEGGDSPPNDRKNKNPDSKQMKPGGASQKQQPAMAGAA